MVPIRCVNRTTSLLIWWADSPDAWEASVRIRPLARSACMPEFQARYFDGLRAVAHDVRVSLDALGLTITRADGQLDRWGRDEVAVKPGSENEPAFRVISSHAPGAQLVVEDAAAIRALTSTLASLQGRARRRHAGYWLGLSAGALAVVAA